ncbi:hypothetical protein Tco_1095015 [Tanacetum coccineum]
MNQVVCKGAKVTKDNNNKRKWEGDHGGSPNQKPSKRYKLIRAFAIGPSNKKEYAGSLPLKRTEEKPEEEQHEDLPIMRDFLEVFPKDLPRLPST